MIKVAHLDYTSFGASGRGKFSDQNGLETQEASKELILSKRILSNSDSLSFYMHGPILNGEGCTLLSVAIYFD